jgi:hypothetical protein
MGSYIPNPRHTSALALSMFEFVGKLMGLSLRFKQSLPFTLCVDATTAFLQHVLGLAVLIVSRGAFRRPSVVWKQLLGQQLDSRDLEVRVLSCRRAPCLVRVSLSLSLSLSLSHTHTQSPSLTHTLSLSTSTSASTSASLALVLTPSLTLSLIHSLSLPSSPPHPRFDA